jgi:hypothetical protein
MDKYNHGGLAVTSLNQGGDAARSSQFRVEEESEDGFGEGLGAGQEKPEILMDWNIAEFLPEKLRVRIRPVCLLMFKGLTVLSDCSGSTCDGNDTPCATDLEGAFYSTASNGTTFLVLPCIFHPNWFASQLYSCYSQPARCASLQ